MEPHSESIKLLKLLDCSERDLIHLLLILKLPFFYDGVGGLRIPQETLRKLVVIKGQTQ